MKFEKNPNNTDMDAVRRKFLEGRFIPVNEILSYGISGHEMHIHLAPSMDFSTGKKHKLLKEGFRKLAIIMKFDPIIEKISATSNIVAEKPERLKRRGFSIEPLPVITKIELYSINALREMGFSDEDPIDIARAVMTRDKFLEKYLPPASNTL